MPPSIQDRQASQERVRGLYTEIFGIEPVHLHAKNTQTLLDRITSLLYANKENQCRLDIMRAVLTRAGIAYGDTLFFEQNVAELVAYVHFNAAVYADNLPMMHKFCAVLDSIYHQMISDTRNKTSLFYLIQSLVRQSIGNSGHMRVIYRVWQEYGIATMAQETAEKNITQFEKFVTLSVAERHIPSAENERRLDRFCNILNGMYKRMAQGIAQYETSCASSAAAVTLSMPPELSWKEVSGGHEADDVIPQDMPFVSEDTMRLARQEHFARHREEEIRENHDALSNAQVSHYVNSFMTDGNNGPNSVATYDTAKNQWLANSIKDRELQGLRTGFDLMHSRYHI